jgi:hypothetical protein
MPLTQQALDNLKLGAGGSYSLARDAISQRIYDTRPFGAVANDYTYFSQAIGGQWIGGVAKTKNETNLTEPGKLPNGQTFLISRFGVSCIAMTASAGSNIAYMHDFMDILESSVFEIKLAGREYDFQIHGRNLLPMPIYGSAPTTPNGRVGDMIASGWVKLDPTPIFLDQLVSFSVVQSIINPVAALTTILNNAAAELGVYNCTMMVVLDGFLTRAK